jgi:hypothetical protein
VTLQTAHKYIGPGRGRASAAARAPRPATQAASGDAVKAAPGVPPDDPTKEPKK